MNRYRCGSLVVVLACVFGVGAESAYYIGNSLTDNINYAGVEKMAENAGIDFEYGRLMIPGAPLGWLWGERTTGFCQPSCPDDALTNMDWDIMTMQVGQWGLNAEAEAATNYINLAKGRNPDIQAYIYATWPDKPWGDYSWCWERSMTESWCTADWFEHIIAKVRNDVPDVKPVCLVPSGHVMYELEQRMKQAAIAGHSTVHDFYNDACHLNNVGSYITGCTMFATICKKDPRGSAVPSEYGSIDGALVQAIQDAVWKVLTEMSDVTGVGGEVPVVYTVRKTAAAVSRDLPALFTLRGERVCAGLHGGNPAYPGLLAGAGGRTLVQAGAKAR
ncbi:MAG: hypothetical protein GF331_22325 [Chitinivibrionales bacterium]|nr:hypothetical protein [Chitinivibrionales bacterium]